MRLTLIVSTHRNGGEIEALCGVCGPVLSLTDIPPRDPNDPLAYGEFRLGRARLDLTHACSRRRELPEFEPSAPVWPSRAPHPNHRRVTAVLLTMPADRAD